MNRRWSRTILDPDGREVVFDSGSYLHLIRPERSKLLDHVDAILGTIETPDFREDDPIAGRERFYRAAFLAPDRWLRVVVDFNEAPAWIVTVFVQERDPRLRRL